VWGPFNSDIQRQLLVAAQYVHCVVAAQSNNKDDLWSGLMPNQQGSTLAGSSEAAHRGAGRLQQSCNWDGAKDGAGKRSTNAQKVAGAPSLDLRLIQAKMHNERRSLIEPCCGMRGI
jgi:hypothetical protein